MKHEHGQTISKDSVGDGRGHEEGQAVLVLGGTGKTGRRVVERLQMRGMPTVIGSRNGAPPFDWQQPHTWEDVVSGVDAVYITYYPDLALPEAADAIQRFSELAVRRGVRRLVMLSGRGEEGALRSEDMLRQAGAEWTILRASWFHQNFSENFLVDQVRGGTVALPVGDVREPFIDAEDIADVAVAALTEDGHAGAVYELTGPELLTFSEATAEISKAIGTDIRFVQLTHDQFIHGMQEQNVPHDVIRLLQELFTNVLDGRNAYVTDGVQRALGRKPNDFASYVRETAKTGVWKG